ncbi:hypothetical protein D3C73_937430 [compost metagenome]
MPVCGTRVLFIEGTVHQPVKRIGAVARPDQSDQPPQHHMAGRPASSRPHHRDDGKRQGEERMGEHDQLAEHFQLKGRGFKSI